MSFFLKKLSQVPEAIRSSSEKRQNDYKLPAEELYISQNIVVQV